MSQFATGNLTFTLTAPRQPCLLATLSVRSNINEAQTMRLPARDRVEYSVEEFYETCIETKGYTRVSDCAMACILESLRDSSVIDFTGGFWTVLPAYGEENNAVPREYFKNMEMVFAHVLVAAAEVLPGRCKADKKVSEFVCCLDCQTASASGVSSIPVHVDALSYLREPTYTREAEAGTAHNYTASTSGRCSTIYTADAGVTWGFKLWDDESSVLRVCLVMLGSFSTS